MNYNDFLATKECRQINYGITINRNNVNSVLFEFQKDIVLWALRKGKCALFLDTGLGKTHCQTEWARLISKRSLIISPLSVARQTIRLAKKITNTEIYYTRNSDDVKNGINITNYEMIEHFDPSIFDAVILDESSILKSIDGAIKRKLMKMFRDTPYKLCCTATPSPNDETEIGNHAEFLGIMKSNEMLATYFIHANKVTERHVKIGDKIEIVRKKQSDKNGQEWRLRNYGIDDFYKWLSTWAVAIKKPSDLNYDDKGYNLPKLNIKPIFIPVDYQPEGQLFFIKLKGIKDRAEIRKRTAKEKLNKIIALLNSNNEQWIVWCGLNTESKQLNNLVDDSIEICGADSAEKKAKAIEDFQDNKYRILITKPKIAGFGMNFQNAHNMIFYGLNDSWESYYQCIRRQWRFGQFKEVNVYIVMADVEREIYDNVMNKDKIANRMTTEMIKHIKIYKMEEVRKVKAIKEPLKTKKIEEENYTIYLGDSCQVLDKIETESIDLSVYSPPFADLYTYSSSIYDLGNSRDWDEFFNHYNFIVSEMLRITKKGRVSCVHTSDIAAMALKDGYIGLKDFPGEVIRTHQKAGWIYHGYAIVSKNPQAQAIRTHSKALLFVQLKKDSSCSRPAILDRVLFFKKPGDSAIPVNPVQSGDMDNETWIDWAGGIWTGINESDTLQFTTARAENDEKHICPLQLGTIDRCIKLYSNVGEIVLTPFMGIGSEAYQAIKLKRKAIGIELKESYFNVAKQNLEDITEKTKEYDLFSVVNQ